MAKINKKQQTKINWLLIAIVVLFAGIPTAITIKLLTEEINPYMVSVLRYVLVVIVALPFVIKAFYQQKKLIMKKLPAMLFSSIIIAIGVPLYYSSVAMSSVLFAEIIGLFGPIFFAIISISVTRDRFSRNALIGLLFAILGGMVMILTPLWSGSGTIVEYGWLPLVFMIIHVIVMAYSLVYYRKMDEEGVPLMATIGVTFFFVLISSIVMAIIDAGPSIINEVTKVSLNGWAMLVYLGIGSTVIFKYIKVKAYEQIGTASQASINYLGVFLGIAAPIIILGDTLSVEMIIGAILVVIGILFTRKHSHHKNKKSSKLHKDYHKYIMHRRHL